jgi:hypothetical protein
MDLLFGVFAHVAKKAYYIRHVRPHLSTLLPLDGFPWKFILETSMKICRKKNPDLVKTESKYRTLYLNIYTMGTGSFPGVKRPGRGADHPPQSKRRGHERVELYLYSPSGSQWLVIGRTFTLTLTPRYVLLFQAT